jgi:hypothetical protein
MSNDEVVGRASAQGVTAAALQGTTTQIAFIDSRPPDITDLINDALPGEQIFVLDPTQDGLDHSILNANDLTGTCSAPAWPEIVHHLRSDQQPSLGIFYAATSNDADPNGSLTFVEGNLNGAGSPRRSILERWQLARWFGRMTNTET